MEIQRRNLLTNEQQLELREWEKLFASPAWTWLLDATKEQRNQLAFFLVKTAMTEGDLRQARGAINELDKLIALESSMESLYSQFVEDATLTSNDLKDSLGANS